MAKNEVKYGAILSYILIIANALYGFIIAPFVMKTIGTSEYGVYKAVGAITASISVLELGIGSTMQRYIAKFNAQKEREKSYNFSAMGFIQSVVLSVAMFAVGIVLFFFIDDMYAKTFTSRELYRAKQIFIVLVIYATLHIYENLLFGVATGYNKFTFVNSLKIVNLFTKILLFVVILPFVKNSLAIVLISLVLEIAVIAIEYMCIKGKLKHKFKLYKWDNNLFKESFLYTILLFVQSLILQFNGNLDNIAIGAMIGTSSVVVYSFAIQIYNMYEQCATSVSSVILPTVTNKIYAGAKARDLEDLVVKFGRVQWAVLGCALFAFLAIGKEFFYLWLGNGFEDCWGLTVILIIPVTFPLVVNVCLAILKVYNLLKFRTVAMAYSVVLNAIVTFGGISYLGYWAAAIGTALSTIVGSIISLNIYYWKKLNINIFKLYLKISGKITPCLVVAFLVVFVLNKFIYGSWITFLAKALIFVVVYVALLLLFGLNKTEKQKILGRKGA